MRIASKMIWVLHLLVLAPHACVARQVSTTLNVEKEDWLWMAIFSSLVNSGDKFCKLIIDGGSYINVISKAPIDRLKLNLNHIRIQTR